MTTLKISGFKLGAAQCVHQNLSHPVKIDKASIIARSSARGVSEFENQFALLSSLIAPECLVQAGLTERGRGLVVEQDLSAGDVLLSGIV